MRREERQHLKENPLASIVGRVQLRLANSGRQLVLVIGGVLIGLVGVAGFYTLTGINEQKAGQLLAEAMETLVAPVVNPDEDTSNVESEGEEEFIGCQIPVGFVSSEIEPCR